MNSPFTREQQMFANSVKRIADALNESNKPKEIDWEQRRYEIAKDLFVGMTTDGYGYHFSSSYPEVAVKYADHLIEELKKNNN